MVTDAFAALRRLIASGGRAVLVTPLDGTAPVVFAADGSLEVGAPVPDEVTAAVREAVRTLTPTVIDADGASFFVEPVAPRPRLVVFGAIAVTDALVPMAAAAGYTVEVVDARPWLAALERYPQAAAVHVGEPADLLPDLMLDPGTCVVSFLHEPRREDPVLIAALSIPCQYVGSMGSRRTTAAKRERLLGAGLEEVTVRRLHAPIGLDIGGVTPREIAVAVLAEIVAVGRGG